MDFLLKLLTVVLALDCLFLILLILIQLPKKDAGAGTAFGGGTTDALFGAGTGNALTKLTTYSAGIFFVLALVLSISNASKSNMERKGRLDKVIASGTAGKLQKGVSSADIKLPGTNTLSVTASNTASAAVDAVTTAVTTNKPAVVKGSNTMVEGVKAATNAAVKAVVDAVGTNQPAKAK